MLRDTKFSQRNLGKSSNLEEKENTPVNTNTIVDEQVDLKSTKFCKTPSKASRSRYIDTLLPLKTPEKQGVLANNPNGVAQKNVLSSNVSEMRIDSSRYYKNGNGAFANVITPISSRPNGRDNSSNSTQSTPIKTVTRPPNPKLCVTGDGTGAASVGGGARMANFAALSKGVPISSSSLTVVNTIEVPHFAIKEDPSFWMDYNVQVLIRVRPLTGAEKSLFGYNRCLKQESAQCINWIGQPESRFTFDHIACETLDQETLFTTVGLPMVENCLSGYNSCIFAYGQTGSGKTYTMLGDINNLGDKSSPDRGMTSRIFEFLFARIQAERESRRDDRLVYNLKCSFSEIYNEQITDLLDPSSTNLLLREDTRTGIYVENLSEYEVQTVGDILKLLSQGSSNRKVAATNMNRESSRSHSVFTCVIESRWETDCMPYLRFARLNLVDLAGSERQKTSGAEGDRLKEAANINKSLSTLGHVIMLLGDAVHAKTKHVPYRDSKLTFLLQDSLGGNSKTMIIANVSPSICCAAETLNTLKFAQRAKLIQNNAVVNEDSPEAVTALKYQIHLLKEELLVYKKQNVARSLTFGSTCIENDSACRIKALEMGCQKKGGSSELESNLKAPSLDEQLFEVVQQENEEMHKILLKRTQEVVDLQLELDILKIMLQEERSFRSDQENKALCLNRDLELAKEKASQLTKQYEDIKEELRVAKSLIEALEAQKLTSFRETEDLRNSSNHYVDQLRKQETEISLLKKQAFYQANPLSCKLSKPEESILQVNFTKMHDSLEEVRRLNTRYQSDFASLASNENEMDEILMHARVETAKVIVCLQGELGILQQQVQKSNLREIETEGKLMILKIEQNELHKKLKVATQNNKSLVEKLDEKDKQFKALSEMLESVTSEIEFVLSCGQKALEDATDQVDAISGSLPQKRKWISEQLSRMTRSISEKDFMIEELTRYLEDATTRRSEMESMLRSLRGAALVITQEHQQDCREKEKEVILLTSELSEKALIIAELENKMKREEEERRKASMCATAAFVVVSRLSEINCDYLNALKNKDIQLIDIKISKKKDIFLHNQLVESDGQRRTCFLRTNLDVARLQLCGAMKHVSNLEQNLKQVEKTNILKTTKILAELKDCILTLESWMKHSGDVLGYQEEKLILDLPAKEIEVLVLASEIEQMAVNKLRMQKEHAGFSTALERVKEDLVLKCLDAALNEWILLDKENEVTHLLNVVEVAITELNERNLEISEIIKVKEIFEQDLKLLKDVACSHDALEKEIGGVTEANMRLSSKITKLEHEYENSLEDMQVSCSEKEKRLQEALQHMQILEQEIAAKDREIGQCKTRISELSQHSGAHACEYKQKPAKNDKVTAGRPHIVELETLAVNGQEILMLDSRLAAARSITHDLLCDLRDLKSDICGYVSLLDKHQAQK